jgi:hypothetical protein
MPLQKVAKGTKSCWYAKEERDSSSSATAQARANAQALSKWLSGKTGERIFVRGIVTIPRWWVDDSTQHPVWVLNPKRIQVFVTRAADSPLPSKLVNQIIYKLTERCRLPPCVCSSS